MGLIPEIENLKAESKLSRDEQDYQEAINELTTAIGLAERAAWDPPGASLDDTGRKIAWHVADCWGMIGGNLRRLKKLPEAIDCFKKGRVYEQDERYGVSGSGYGIASSYNTVNAIVAPIEARMVGAHSQQDSFRSAVQVLKRQTLDPEHGVRRPDRWAWADRGQCSLLMGDLEGAKAAYLQFCRLSDPGSIRSSCNVLKSLHDALRDMGDPVAPVVGAGIDFLQSELQERS
jgi:hypothetical protein